MKNNHYRAYCNRKTAFIAAANSCSPAMFGADDLLDHPDTNNHRQKTVPLIMAGESMAAEYRGWSVGAAMLGKTFSIGQQVYF
jgi:hypothetical protein